MNRSDIIVSASVTPKALWSANLNQIVKTLWSTKNILVGNFRQMRKHKWARKDAVKRIRGLFSTMEVETSLSIYRLVRAITREQFAQFLDDYVNCGMKDYRDGEALGKILQTTHPTLQASVIRLAMGIIIGLSKDKSYTDARNETPIAMGKKIAKMVEDGELKMGWMI